MPPIGRLVCIGEVKIISRNAEKCPAGRYRLGGSAGAAV